MTPAIKTSITATLGMNSAAGEVTAGATLGGVV